MSILLQILILAGIGMVAYAIFGIFSSKESKPAPKEDKLQRLEEKITSLTAEAEKVKTDYANLQKEFEITRVKELQLQEELARSKDWVAKSEQILNKAKEENADLKNKFIAKDKELQEEFAKNVNLNKETRDLKEKTLSLEKEIKDKSDQIEAQKHRIEKCAEELRVHLETIAEFKKKDEISEWVPKPEFNKLNEEYSELEKELEEKGERLKTFALEISQLKNQLSKKEQSQPPQEEKEESP
jgi:chromosome segregation ATPase